MSLDEHVVTLDIDSPAVRSAIEAGIQDAIAPTVKALVALVLHLDMRDVEGNADEWAQAAARALARGEVDLMVERVGDRGDDVLDDVAWYDPVSWEDPDA